MVLASTLLHFGALFSIQLLALTGALFLFVYIKKENMNKWFSFAAAAILGLVLLTMIASFVGAICMHCCEQSRRAHEGGERREERMIIRGGMGEGMEMMERHHRMMEMKGEGMECGECPEGACKEGMECCKEGGKCEMDGKGGKCEMDGKGGKCEMEMMMKGGHGEMGGKHMMIKKDTIKPKK
jgi:hypothetical protein